MKFADLNQKIAEKVVAAYKCTESAVVGGYQAVEKGAVSAWKRLEERCIRVFFARTGESVEEARCRLHGPNSAKNP